MLRRMAATICAPDLRNKAPPTGVSEVELMPVANSAQAQTIEYDKTIDALGVIGNQGYLTLVGGFSATCNHGFVYVDLTSVGGRATYATLLAAKLTGNPLEQLAYAAQVRPVDPTQTLCYVLMTHLRN